MAAALAAGDGYCVPEMIYSDGLGGLNSLATDRRFTALADCGEPPPTEDPFPDSAGIWIYGWEPTECFNISWDIDNDGVHNGCENALAQHFAPLLIMAHDCNWDNSPGFNRMGGEYYFAVQRASAYSDTLRIAYLPAYYLDCGTPADMLGECSFLGLDFSWCNGHTGDSEFILIDLAYNPATTHWLMRRVFLSAHCNVPLTGYNCGWYAPFHFAWRDGRSFGAPEIWVAEGKHANYYSQSHCNHGALNFDECSYNTDSRVFPVVYGQQNIGSRATPLRDCAGAFWGSPRTSQRLECLWSAPWYAPRFNGWQSGTINTPATPYTEHLSQFAGF